MNRTVVLVIVLAVALGAAALYGINRQGGNDSVAAACADAPGKAAALSDLVKGEVAAFQLARKADDVSDLAFQGEGGEPMTLAAFSGKVALVNLWATWCAPCRVEMPSLDHLQAEQGGDDFQVVTINIDTGTWDRPEQFLKEAEIRTLPRYRDSSTKIFEAMKVRGLALGLPVTLLVDRDGCLIGHVNGPAEWNSEDALKLIAAARGA